MFRRLCELLYPSLFFVRVSISLCVSLFLCARLYSLRTLFSRLPCLMSRPTPFRRLPRNTVVLD